LRYIFIFIPPLGVGALNVLHPIAHAPLYEGILHHVDWWIGLHLLNLAGFPLIGFAAFLLTDGIRTPVAILSRTAAAVFIPIYAGFDALMGIGTGILVKVVSTLSPDQRAAVEPVLDSYWNSDIIVATAVVGSIAWTIALLSAAVALTVRKRRWLVGSVAVVLFFVIGWARTNLMSADGGTISTGWWVVVALIGLVMLAVGEPRLPAVLLVWAAALFGAAHPMPTGPLGLACFFGAAVCTEFFQRVRMQAAGEG
jgi:hypothetical protein